MIQYIYDTHVDGSRRVEESARLWTQSGIVELIDPLLYARVADRLQEQVRSAREWRDQITTYFFRKSGVRTCPGRFGREIFP